MAKQWHYSKGDKRLGPITDEELRKMAADGRLSRSDLVWCDGMPDWRPAGEEEGLFAGPPPLPGGPPPLPGTTASPASDSPAGKSWRVELVNKGMMSRTLRVTLDHATHVIAYKQKMLNEVVEVDGVVGARGGSVIGVAGCLDFRIVDGPNTHECSLFPSINPLLAMVTKVRLVVGGKTVYSEA